jgi:hypothetical protein
MDLPEMLAEYVPAFSSLMLSLSEAPGQLLQGSALALSLRALQSADASPEVLTEVLRSVARGLAALPEASKPELTRALKFVYLMVLHRRRADEHKGLVDAIAEEVAISDRREAEEAFMTGAQQYEAQGRKEGRAELLREQLEAKFGPLEARQVEALMGLGEARAKELGVRLLNATSLQDLGIP